MLIFAHRGASSVAAENTLAAFELALVAKADAIELDLHQVDQQLYVFHDRRLQRLTGVAGLFAEQTQAQIQTLSVLGEQPIPTLEQALACIAGRCLVNIELKTQVDYSLLFPLLQTATTQWGFTEQSLLFSSFNHHWLAALKQARPASRLGVLTASCPLDYAACASQLNACAIHIDIEVVNLNFVQDAHQRGLAVYVYTVDDADDMRWLKKMGVNGIFTNHPQFARQVLSSTTSF